MGRAPPLAARGFAGRLSSRDSRQGCGGRRRRSDRREDGSEADPAAARPDRRATVGTRRRGFVCVVPRKTRRPPSSVAGRGTPNKEGVREGGRQSAGTRRVGR
jgi:hypothetical protein